MMHFTITEQRILNRLKDGNPHRAEELLGCIDDELASRMNLAHHIYRIRNKLKPIGETIVNVPFQRRSFYQHFRYLETHNNEG